MPGSDAEVVVHDALAFIYFDEKSRVYRFQTHLGTGAHQDAEAKAIEGGLEWGFKDPRGFTVRFTIKPPDRDTYYEFGEMSIDGNSWRKFYEMTLKRQK